MHLAASTAAAPGTGSAASAPVAWVTGPAHRRVAFSIATCAVLGTMHSPLAAQMPRAWTVDTASVTFEVRNAGLPVRGSFRDVDIRLLGTNASAVACGRVAELLK